MYWHIYFVINVDIYMKFMLYLIEYLLHIFVFNSNLAFHFPISHLLRFSNTTQQGRQGRRSKRICQLILKAHKLIFSRFKCRSQTHP